MAKRKKKRAPARARSRKKQQEDYPGWMWMIFGLAIGLSVAFAIYMKDRRETMPLQSVAQQPASMSGPMEREPVATNPEPVADATAAAEEKAEPRFSFYNMLPSFEVVIPEEESDVSRDREVEAIQEPGTYVLQAGSFAALADADRRRAELALLGLESRIQRVSIDDKTFHRVRIGPVSDLDELNLIRNQLRQAKIDVLRIRLAE
jgi:cell division protein FtsN